MYESQVLEILPAHWKVLQNMHFLVGKVGDLLEEIADPDTPAYRVHRLTLDRDEREPFAYMSDVMSVLVQ